MKTNITDIQKGIKTLGLKIPKKITSKINDAGKLNNIFDVFNLNIDILVENNIGMYDANRCLDEIDRIKSSKIMDYQLLDSLISSSFSFSEVLKKQSYSDFISNKESLLMKLSGQLLEEMVNNYEVLLKLDDVLNVTVSFNDKKQLRGTGNTKTICFTGKGFLSRSKLGILANQLGFEPVSTVIKDLDVLVCEDPFTGTVKLEKAAQNGTKIMSYDEFQLRVEKQYNPDEIIKILDLDF